MRSRTQHLSQRHRGGETQGEAIRTTAFRDNGSVIVRISDNGEGIPEGVKGRLFQPFHSSKPNGTGLGLFAAKHILEMHQGSVEVESREGQGTSVTVRLPAAPHEKGEGAPRNRSDTLLLELSR